MLRSKAYTISALTWGARCISGYKMNAENYPRKKAPENYTEEDYFQEKIDIAVMNRAKIKLYGLEKISQHDLADRVEGADPNEPYRGQNDLPTYGSFQNYFFAAESERRRQGKEGVWWDTLNKWLKKRQSDCKDVGSHFAKKKTESGTPQNRLREIRNDQNLERAARNRTLIINPDEVMDEWEDNKTGIMQIKKLAHHYNVYQDLFENADFHPILPIQIGYRVDDELVNPVFYGNELLPSETETQPLVNFEAESDIFYTLLCTNPDGHLEDNSREYAQWLVGNIPGNEICRGQTLLDYMRPFPARGTGYHRMVFVLFQQTEKVDFSSEMRRQPCTMLRERDFKTSEFFQKYERQLTPVSLRFYQTKWDYSVQRTYHEILSMPEPVYEYEKVSEQPRLAKLTYNPQGKTLQWLARFMPKEPVYPDGSRESKNLIRQAAIQASATPQKREKQNFPVKTVY